MPIFPYNGVWPTIADDVFIAPGAMVIGNVTLAQGVSVWFNAVLRGDTAPIVVGRNTNIQDNCTLHVDPDAPLTIGEECTIGHNAIVHGAQLGDRVLIGMNATILSHSTVGSLTVIGANSLVAEHKEIPSSKLAVGSPARVLRTLTEEKHTGLAASAAHYAHLAQEYRAQLSEHPEQKD
jgi:carbonic anhydrase/acetyltransferase-like protein (isoleucine patch superfamily)